MSRREVRRGTGHSRTGETLKGSILVTAFAMLTAFSLAPAGALNPDTFVPVALYNENGELVYLQEIDPNNPLLIKTTHYLRLGDFQPSQDKAKPGSGGADPGTDCESDAYKLTGWHWTSPYSAKSDQHASIFNSAGNAWDAATGASIFGGVQSGNDGTAGVQDFKNNIQWVNLGASSTVAQTLTWAYRGSGEAVESDAQYNTYYPWSTSGASNAMDVANVATHEVGHTFGLNHPTSTSTNSCLTMYAYVNYGQTFARTLGDGDILGIKAIYGS